MDPYYGKTISIVKKGTDGKDDSDPQEDLTIKPRPKAPSKDGFEVKNGEEKSTIKGIGEDQEYSTDDGKTWKPGPGKEKEIEVPAGTNVLVRDKATDKEPASDFTTVETQKVPSNTTDSSKKQETTPNAKVDYTAEKLTDLVPNADYIIKVDDKTVEVKADAEGKANVSDYYGKTVSIIKKGDNATTTDSEAQQITVAGKTVTPAEDKFTISEGTSGNVVIKDVTSDYEYSKDNGNTWISGDGSDVTVPEGTIVLIRVKATATSPASEPIKVVATAYESADAVEQQILNANTDKGDPADTTFGTLRLKATGKNKSVKLTWKKVKDADGYIIYGSRCGVKMEKITTVKGASKKSYTQKKLKKGKYYKYIVVAYKTIDGKDYVIAKSQSAHATTTGGKNGNPTKVSVKSSKVQLKKGKKKTIKASYVSSKKIKVHIAKFRYESSNTDVATVDKKGKIQAKKKGKATIYVYAQNGVYKTVKVTVK